MKRKDIIFVDDEEMLDLICDSMNYDITEVELTVDKYGEEPEFLYKGKYINESDLYPALAKKLNVKVVNDITFNNDDGYLIAIG